MQKCMYRKYMEDHEVGSVIRLEEINKTVHNLNFLLQAKHTTFITPLPIQDSFIQLQISNYIELQNLVTCRPIKGFLLHL